MRWEFRNQWNEIYDGKNGRVLKRNSDLSITNPKWSNRYTNSWSLQCRVSPLDCLAMELPLSCIFIAIRRQMHSVILYNINYIWNSQKIFVTKWKKKKRKHLFQLWYFTHHDWLKFSSSCIRHDVRKLVFKLRLSS